MFLFQGPIIATLFGSAEPEVISNAHTYLACNFTYLSINNY